MDASRIKEDYTRPIERVIDRLDSVKERNGSFMTLCPAHPDRKQSLSVSEGQDGRALLTCFAGCETPEIVKVVGLDMRDLFADERREIKLPSTPRKTTATAQPCTLENYAEAKGLLIEFLQKLGLRNQKH
jgi:hypothetical protein